MLSCLNPPAMRETGSSLRRVEAQEEQGMGQALSAQGSEPMEQTQRLQ